MNKLFRPYLAFLLMGSLLTFSACKDDDDPGPDDEGEVITAVTLALTPTGKGQDATATMSTLSGTPKQDGPLILRANTEYNATITLTNESTKPPVDITTEVRQESDEHLFDYNFEASTGNPSPTMKVEITDTDKNNRPVGLETKITTGPAGTGKLRVVLKHQPGGTKTGAITGGKTDVDVNFDVIIN